MEEIKGTSMENCHRL